MQAKHVLGAQANLWSEYFPTGERVEYAAYPRAAALAEVLWSPPATHDWRGFLDRLVGMQARYRQLGIHYAQSAFAVHIEAAYDAKQKSVQVKLSNQVEFGAIHYTLDGAAPTSQAPRYGAAFNTHANGEVRAVAFERGEPLADAQVRKLDPAALLRRNSAELAQCNPASGVILKLPQDAAVGTSNQAYVVDIFDPCWIYQQADLSHSLIAILVDRLPYNFQLWKDAKNIVSRKPTTHAQGELQVHVDRCDGELIAAIPLATALTRAGATTLAAPLGARAGLHDLCLRFATNGHDPMWVINWAEVSPSQQP
jgi:hexosaminidase